MSTDDLNPMMNELVLTRFFELCALPDLLNFRLVSRQWYSASLPMIRNDMVVKVTSDANKNLNWSNFDQQWNVEEGVPFRYFHIRGMDFVPPPSKNRPNCNYYFTKKLSDATSTSITEIHENMNRFWVVNGQFIRKLTLLNCTVFSVEAFNRAIFEASPNLEELTLINVQVDNGEDHGENKDIIGRVHMNLKFLRVGCIVDNFLLPRRSLFLHFPNLQKLNLLYLEGSLPLLLEACESLDEIPLNELILDDVKPSEAFPLKELLSLRQLKLTNLELDVDDCEEVDARSILEVALRHQGGTLKTLIVDNLKANLKYDHSEEPANNFPFRLETFEELTILMLIGPVACNNFSFLRQTPNLTHLQLGAIVDEEFKAGVQSVKSILLPCLKCLCIQEGCIPAQEMEVLAKIMPNVECFEGALDPSTLRVIFNNCWPNLKYLLISPPLGIDDEVLTGIKEGCAERLPNITALKGLEGLEIDIPQVLGESSIWNGFLELPNLRWVSVNLSSDTSQEAIEALKQRTYPETRDWIKQLSNGEDDVDDPTGE